MKVRLTPEARGKIDDALYRILLSDVFAARRYRDRVALALRRLGQFPQLGHFVPEYPTAPIKQFIVEPYRFFYFIDERRRVLWVVDVWHGAQIPDYPQLPAAEPGR